MTTPIQNKPTDTNSAPHVKSFTEMSHPEARADARESAADQQAAIRLELVGTTKQIDAFRNARKNRPSDKLWCQQWPGLGSTKTWSAILRGKFDTINIDEERWLSAYRGVLSALKSDVEERGQEELYGDLTAAESVSLAALRLQHHRGKDRLILIEGTSGSGKTSCLDLLMAGDAAGAMVMLEADDSWGSPRAALAMMLRAMGEGGGKRPIPYDKHARKELLITAIQRRGRVIIAIDEAHHCTGPVLNLIKTLLNRTDALIILAGMDTLFRKLRAAASEEAKQLYHNRLFARIVLKAPSSEDARVFLERRLELSEGSGWKAATLKQLCSMSARAGMWAFFRRLADNLRDGALPLDDASLLSAGQSAAREIA